MTQGTHMLLTCLVAQLLLHCCRPETDSSRDGKFSDLVWGSLNCINAEATTL